MARCGCAVTCVRFRFRDRVPSLDEVLATVGCRAWAADAPADVLVLPVSVGWLGKREVPHGVMWRFAKFGEGRPQWVCASAPSREP